MRAVLVVLLAFVVLVAPDAAAEPAIPTLPLSIAVAQVDGVPVVSDAWLAEQVAEAERLLGAQGVHVAQARRRGLHTRHATLLDARDRDALAAELGERVINVFIVKRLHDVPEQKKLRMGVRWRKRSDLRQDYVIVAANALPTTLAHELGHFFGNGHSGVTNNIMSYKHEDPTKIAFNSQQGRRMRAVARRHLRRGTLMAHVVKPTPVD